MEKGSKGTKTLWVVLVLHLLPDRKMQVIKSSCHTTCSQLNSPLNRLTPKSVVFYCVKPLLLTLCLVQSSTKFISFAENFTWPTSHSLLSLHEVFFNTDTEVKNVVFLRHYWPLDAETFSPSPPLPISPRMYRTMLKHHPRKNLNISWKQDQYLKNLSFCAAM